MINTGSLCKILHFFFKKGTTFNASLCTRYRLLIGWQLSPHWSQGNLHFIRLRVTNYRLYFLKLDREFSAFCQVLRGSILLPPRHPYVLARMARWQFVNVDWFAIFKGIMCFSVPSIIWVGTVLKQITRQRRALAQFHPLEMPKICPF